MLNDGVQSSDDRLFDPDPAAADRRDGEGPVLIVASYPLTPTQPSSEASWRPA